MNATNKARDRRRANKRKAERENAALRVIVKRAGIPRAAHQSKESAVNQARVATLYGAMVAHRIMEG